MTPDTLCPGCFGDKGRTNPCPHCGYDETVGRSPLVLPHRTLLQDQFLIGRVLGKPGGFGITYLARDIKLEAILAIKEYLPRDLAGREANQTRVMPHSREDGKLFDYGLNQFLAEARTLVQLDHPNIVRVRHLFETNGTAYLVMDYYRGQSLGELLEQQGKRPEQDAVQLLMPILDGLRAVHAKGFLHRDIKPDNLYLATVDGGGIRPILLDFGAARQAVGERSRSLSVIFTPGYAPFEQYHRKGKQGPWTDIYSAAAVLYRMVTGETPPEANERVAEDDLRPAAAFGVSRQLSDALGQALAIQPPQRPQSVHGFQAAITNQAPPPQPPPMNSEEPDSDWVQHDPSSDDPGGTCQTHSPDDLLPSGRNDGKDSATVIGLIGLSVVCFFSTLYLLHTFNIFNANDAFYARFFVGSLSGAIPLTQYLWRNRRTIGHLPMVIGLSGVGAAYFLSSIFLLDLLHVMFTSDHSTYAERELIGIRVLVSTLISVLPLGRYLWKHRHTMGHLLIVMGLTGVGAACFLAFWFLYFIHYI